ncbi:glycosyl hydrolase [Cohnella silvisoli]|uniref:Glycosyl hydrolase n=1 Tax=Cohnella silvisoli TaxID=2873699 RepID=A0ABV1KSG3_9BACL|nr:glycosyl hydrolase [Cohnella silvisoli]MCD9022540.1 hypothetical protein [Cohnella silvisoli]
MQSQSWIETFINPPKDARMLKIIHAWPDDPAQAARDIAQMVRQGYGGVVCNQGFDGVTCDASMDGGYVESAFKWATFRKGVELADEAGLTMWLYDEAGFPSGVAWGITLRDRPEWEAAGLFAAETITEGEGVGGQVHLEIPPGTLVSAAAYPLAEGVADLGRAIDLTPHVQAGRISWAGGMGEWRVVAITSGPLFEGTHTGVSGVPGKQKYINLLLPEPVQQFIRVTHDRYAEQLGGDLGRYFEAAFTDEPSLMSLFMREMPYKPLPWSDRLAGQFRERYGYELMPVLSALFIEAGNVSRRVRFDFWQLIGELVSDNYFGALRSWCREHNLPSGGHLLLEEFPVQHVPNYGDLFRCLRQLDAPGMDCLTMKPAQAPWMVAKMVGSIADLQGKLHTMSETTEFHELNCSPPLAISLAEYRGTCNRLIAGGINKITTYSKFPELSDEELAELNVWIGRCCALLKGGRHVADVAVYYPIESLWTAFAPSRHWVDEAGPQAERIAKLFEDASNALYKSQYEFTYLDNTALSACEVSDGKLVYGELSWKALVLPGVTTLRSEAVRVIEAFWRAGGTVIALGDVPVNTEQSFPCPDLQALSANIFDGSDNGYRIVDDVATALPATLVRDFVKDVTVGQPDSELRVAHRLIEGKDIYFIINDSPDAWEGDVTIAGVSRGGTILRLDPATGDATPIEAGRPIRLALGEYGGVLLVVDKTNRTITTEVTTK